MLKRHLVVSALLFIEEIDVGIDPALLPAHIKKQLKKAGAQLPAGKKESKYGAVKVKYDGISFDSKAEGLRYLLNKQRIAGGELAYQLIQVPFRLPGNTKYIVDFLEAHVDGRIVYVDVKGKITEMFRLKKKQVEALYPVEIVCLKCADYTRMQFEPVTV